MKNTCSKINTITAVLLLCAVMLSFPVFAKETDESSRDSMESSALSEADQIQDNPPEEQEMLFEEVPPKEPESLMPTAEQTVPDENPAENEQGQDNPEEKQDDGKSPDSDMPEETVVDPIRMSELNTPQVDAGSRVKFSITFTAVEGYEIESVEMQTSTDINVFPFNIDSANNKVFYNSDKAEYPFDLRARLDAVQNYYNVTVIVTYKNKKQEASTAVFEIPVLVVNRNEPEEDEPAGPAPKLIVTSVCTVPEPISPGEEFIMNVGIKNTSNIYAVTNAVVTITSQDRSVSAESGSTTAYIESIYAGSTKTVSMKMRAKNGLASGTYYCEVKVTYCYNDGTDGLMTETVSFQVFAKPVVTVSAIDAIPAKEVYLGETVKLSAGIYNTGQTDAKNVFAEFYSEDGAFGSKEVYVGDIAAGTQGNAAASLTGLSLGKTKILIKVRYEDSDGNRYEQNGSLDYSVAQIPESNYVIPVPEEKKSYTGVIIGTVSGILAASIAAYLYIRKNKDSFMKD